MSIYAIEGRSFRFLKIISHNFWVVGELDGKIIAELHGLAVDRTGQVKAVGKSTDLLKVHHYVHNADYASRLGTKASYSSLVLSGQRREVALHGTFGEVMERWEAAVKARDYLNGLGLTYPGIHQQFFPDVINSNSIYTTLGSIMNVHVVGFPWCWQPGYGNLALSEQEIQKLQYSPQGVIK